MSKICLCGNWHQFLVLSACFADLGHTVLSVPVDESDIEKLENGILPIFEPRLEDLTRKNISDGRLKFTGSYKLALESADFVFISVDTPVLDDDSSDMSIVFEIIESVITHISGPLILCLTSQVPIGTSRKLSQYFNEKCAYDIQIAYIPEFLRLGSAIDTFNNADRIIIGTESTELAEKIEHIYVPLHQPILRTDLETAEMIKHASNAFLANSISFINEIANLCEVTGADVKKVAAGMKLDSRIGENAYLGAGLGFSGGTLGRDLHNLQRVGGRTQVKTPLMDAIFEVNRNRIHLVIRRLKGVFPCLKTLKVVVWGLTYKGNTDTLRRSNSITIIKMLSDEGCDIRIYDPIIKINELDQKIPGHPFEDPVASCNGSDALVLMTPWNGIADIDFQQITCAMNQAVILDTCNYFDRTLMESFGFTYLGV